MSGKTLVELAKDLRQMAELTAKHSQNWENFEKIALDMFKAVYEAGKEEVFKG